MLIATLAASVAYQAGLNPPGGFWSDDEGHYAGDPLLHDINRLRYKTFFCFNAISFMASIVVIMLLLSKSIRKKAVPLEQGDVDRWFIIEFELNHVHTFVSVA
ncbi:hypothetical protein HU200_060156 [Digitaria exilis]|uniref:PGG domain-containing protein n=1 Tax=Digitaria exilis TaxID=1010633 RepID=A0A835AK00_9POAL|nr:hypothetical protein HU200_060156 [Digitaria exilis]